MKMDFKCTVVNHVTLIQCVHLLILPFPLCPQYDYRKDRERRDDYRGRDRDYDRGLYVC